MRYLILYMGKETYALKDEWENQFVFKGTYNECYEHMKGRSNGYHQ